MDSRLHNPVRRIIYLNKRMEGFPVKEQHRQSFLYGTIILAAGTVAVKLIGALFKIPLTNILGGVGMSCFNVAYDLYYPLYALFVAGVPVAVSRLVSESMARGRVRDARRLLRVSVGVFFIIGAAGSFVMFMGAGWFSDLVRNPDARLAVQALSPALFLGCVMAAFRGYWQGMQEMLPTAISQVVEAVTRLLFGLAFSYGIVYTGLREYRTGGTVFGAVYPSLEQAQLAVLPYGAAGAILGVTVSSFCGAFYMVVRHKLGKGSIRPEVWRAAPPAASSRALARRLVALALPVCFAAVISNLTSFIDLISVMNRLNHAIINAPELLLTMYDGAIPSGIGLDRLGSYLYGCYSGLAVPIYNLVPSLTTTIGVSLLPAVTAAWTTHNRLSLERNICSSLRLASMIAMPAGLGVCAMAEPVLRLLFFSRPMEVAVIAPALRIMGISAVFVAISLPVNAILQAVGRAGLPVRLLLIGGLLKLGLNYLLVAVPQLNIQAAPVGTLACYLLVVLASLWALVGVTGVRIPAGSVFGKPLFASVCCAVAARTSHDLIFRLIPSRFVTLLAIVIGGLVYLCVVFLTKTVTKTDIFMLPGGEKFAKALEKHSLLG